jgi:hypothetical protein
MTVQESWCTVSATASAEASIQLQPLQLGIIDADAALLERCLHVGTHPLDLVDRRVRTDRLAVDASKFDGVGALGTR